MPKFENIPQGVQKKKDEEEEEEKISQMEQLRSIETKESFSGKVDVWNVRLTTSLRMKWNQPFGVYHLATAQ